MTTTLASFPRAAANYDRYATVQRAMATWLAEWLPADRLGRALEIGAGTGNFTQLAHHWSRGFVATDSAPAMCEVAQQKMPGLEWRVMSAEAPLTGPWDWLLSSAMLQWLEDPRTVFRAWAHELNPGGRILGALFVAGSLPEWRSIAGKYDPLFWRTPAEWRSHLEHAGLQVARDETQSRVFHYESSRHFLRSLHGVGAAPATRVSGPVLRRLLGQMDEQYLQDGRLPVTWNFYRFIAERESLCV